MRTRNAPAFGRYSHRTQGLREGGDGVGTGFDDRQCIDVACSDHRLMNYCRIYTQEVIFIITKAGIQRGASIRRKWQDERPGTYTWNEPPTGNNLSGSSEYRRRSGRRRIDSENGDKDGRIGQAERRTVPKTERR